MILTHEQPTWFDKCVEATQGSFSWYMDFMRYVFHMCTMNTSYRINFPIVSKLMCMHLLGDSNIKCTHLGGVRPIICNFETNIFASLSL
jgi:hypothetical protein